MIKLLLFLNEIDYGGAEKIVLKLIKELSNYNISVSLCCISKTNNNIINTQFEKKIKLIELKTSLKKSLPKIIKTINQEKPDVVLSTLWPLNSIVAIAKILSKHKFRLILRDGNPYIPKAASDFKMPLFLIRLIVSFTYFLADNIISVSKGSLNNLNNFSFINLRKKNKLIYNFIDVERKISKKNKNEKYISILSIGRFKPQKDFETIIYAINELKKNVDIKLHLLGSGQKKRSIETLVKKLNLEETVIFYGEKDNVYEFFDKCDFFIHSSYYEGFGNVILEALNSKIKIISTDSKYGPKELLDNGRYGKLVEIGDFNKIFKEVIENIEEDINYEDRKKWISKNFSTKKNVKKYYELILNLYKKQNKNKN